MRGLTDEERKLMLEAKGACLCREGRVRQFDAHEQPIIDALFYRGLIGTLQCLTQEIDGHAVVTQAGRYVLAIDAMARGLTVPV
jgi:hypothetical protein